MISDYFDLTDDIVDVKGLLYLEPSVSDIEGMVQSDGCIATNVDIWFSERLGLWVWSCNVKDINNVYN